MNIITVSLLVCYVILFSDCKVLHRSTSKPVKDVSFEKPKRGARAAVYEDADSTIEDSDSYEDPKRRIPRHQSSTDSKNQEIVGSRTYNLPSALAMRKKYDYTSFPYSKHSIELVKKPIPKFLEIDDDDFQGNVMRTKTIDSDSSPDIHEDEDFNVDDYDFDFNHDEFSGRLKPLQPRVKPRQVIEKYKTAQTAPHTEKQILVTNKPTNYKSVSDIGERVDKESSSSSPTVSTKNLKPNKFKEDEYYDPTFTKKSERDERDLLKSDLEDFDDNDENAD